MAWPIDSDAHLFKNIWLFPNRILNSPTVAFCNMADRSLLENTIRFFAPKVRYFAPSHSRASSNNLFWVGDDIF